MKTYIKNLKSIFLLITITIITAACSKNSEPVPAFNESKLAPLSVEFDNIIGDRTLTLNNTTTPYTNAAGEQFTVSQLQYFISNIKLTTASGKTYTVKQDESYFLIKSSDKSTRFAKVNVPEADYTKLTFTIGVDSLRSTMDIAERKGVLDPAGGMTDGMYWGWNAGYIFFKFEGNSNVISDDVNGESNWKKSIQVPYWWLWWLQCANHQ
ncbi:MbnP family protein [Pedobacter sp. UC225_65]|uniref:MbnP family protein n=1 Tax=Pedobacter sp. UC225_65 TaxID=3350173 RepID=UPI00366DCDBD